MIGLLLGITALLIGCIASVWHTLGHYQTQLGNPTTRRQALVTILKSFIGRN